MTNGPQGVSPPPATLRVLHVVPAIAPRYGGPSIAVLEMCQRLTAAGVETLIASTDADGGGRLDVVLGRPIKYQSASTIFFRRQWSEAFKYSSSLSAWLRGHVADFDVVHIHAVFSHASLAAAAAARSAGVPYVVRPLGSLSHWALRHKRVRKFVFWHGGVGAMLRDADAVHYTSHAEHQQAEAALGLSRGVVIPLGIDIDEQDRGTSLNVEGHRASQVPCDVENCVLALGRLHPVKGLELLIDAFIKVVRGGLPGWKLKLAGDGQPDYVAGLKRRVREHSAGDLVEFTGWLTGDDKESALRGARLLAMPSHQENFGIAAFEALARGVPVLVSDQIDWGEELAAAGAGWVARLDGRSLGDALAAALASQAERTARGQAGKDFVRTRFAWPVVTARLEQLYRGLARAQSPSGHDTE
jgi:glycosyltransferase involved in cell wall biosynthesis